MKDHQILVCPIITEKSTVIKEKTGELVFRVHPRATKVDVRNAIERSFGVRVASVRTVNMRGKFKRQGRTAGYRPDWKKAYVTLAEGSKGIEYFEL